MQRGSGAPRHLRVLSDMTDVSHIGRLTYAEPDELGGHDHEPLVAEVVRLVVVHALDSDDVGLYLRSFCGSSRIYQNGKG